MHQYLFLTGHNAGHGIGFRIDLGGSDKGHSGASHWKEHVVDGFAGRVTCVPCWALVGRERHACFIGEPAKNGTWRGGDFEPGRDFIQNPESRAGLEIWKRSSNTGCHDETTHCGRLFGQWAG